MAFARHVSAITGHYGTRLHFNTIVFEREELGIFFPGRLGSSCVLTYATM